MYVDVYTYSYAEETMNWKKNLRFAFNKLNAFEGKRFSRVWYNDTMLLVERKVNVAYKPAFISVNHRVNKENSYFYNCDVIRESTLFENTYFCKKRKKRKKKREKLPNLHRGEVLRGEGEEEIF